MDLIKINVDGLPYDAAPEVVNFIKKESKRANDAETALKSANDATSELQGKFDAQSEELEKLKAVDNDAEIQKAVDARFSLIASALPHLDEETAKTINKLSEKEIQIAVIKSDSKDFNADDKDAVYLKARFDAVIEKGPASDAMARQRQAVNNNDGKNNDGNKEPDAEKARLDMIERLRNGYKADTSAKAK